MSDIRIRRVHRMPHARARKEAERIADDLREKFELDYEWDGDTIRFRRQGVTGHLAVASDHVHLEAKLGFLLAFLKPTIEGHINENLDRVFGAPSAEKKKTTTARSPAAEKKRKG